MRDRTQTLADEIVACNLDVADMDLINRVSGWGGEEWAQVDGDSVPTVVQLAVVANLAAQAVWQEVRFVADGPDVDGDRDVDPEPPAWAYRHGVA